MTPPAPLRFAVRWENRPKPDLRRGTRERNKSQDSVISSARRNARSAIGWPKEIAAVQMESPNFSRWGGRPAAVSRSAPSHAGSAGIVEAGRLGGVAVQRDHRRVIELAGLVQIVDGPG
jgi:hypothetical protein